MPVKLPLNASLDALKEQSEEKKHRKAALATGKETVDTMGEGVLYIVRTGYKVLQLLRQRIDFCVVHLAGSELQGVILPRNKLLRSEC